jgi:hypothetical protein
MRRRSGPPRPGTARPAGHGKVEASLNPILTVRGGRSPEERYLARLEPGQPIVVPLERHTESPGGDEFVRDERKFLKALIDLCVESAYD